MPTPSYSSAAQASSTFYLEGLEPGSGAFGAALAAAERASVTPARRNGRSFSQVSLCHFSPLQVSCNFSILLQSAAAALPPEQIHSAISHSMGHAVSKLLNLRSVNGLKLSAMPFQLMIAYAVTISWCSSFTWSVWLSWQCFKSVGLKGCWPYCWSNHKLLVNFNVPALYLNPHLFTLTLTLFRPQPSPLTPVPSP